MKTAKISLNSIDKVKAFVNEISKFDCDFDLVSGRYVIDAKSIMGIFSLDLSKPIDLNADYFQIYNRLIYTVYLRGTVSDTVPLFSCFQNPSVLNELPFPDISVIPGNLCSEVPCLFFLI